MNILDYYKNNGFLRPSEIYIHIPFCEKKCSYCDFLSFSKKEDFFDKYINQLLIEIKNKSVYLNSKDVCSIYIGGGTPSYIDAEYIKSILEAIKENYNTTISTEISIECNPHSAIQEKLEIYKEMGINRLSIGLQSAHDNELKELGRIHTYEDFLHTIESVLKLKFTNYNIDLMNGIPLQTTQSWKSTLKSIINFKPTHISTYNLILEEDTLLKKLVEAGEVVLPLEEEIIQMDNDTDEILTKHGYNRYEISNFSKPGFECRHNLGYWSDIPYLGLGLGSASYINNVRYKNYTSLQTYLEQDFNSFQINENEASYYTEMNILSEKQLMDEFVMLGLRKLDGVNINQFKQKFNKDISDVYGVYLYKYVNESLIKIENGYYKFSKRGMNVSNKILSDLLFNG